LTDGRRTALPRHRTLRVVLDWSHELLKEAERLRRLAVYLAGFTLDAVAAVTNDPGPEVASARTTRAPNDLNKANADLAAAGRDIERS
jgi:predicted ATPase